MTLDTISEAVSRAVEQLLGRASGPLHFRLLMQPVVAGILAIRAGRKDAREGKPPFFWSLVTQPEARKQQLRSGWKDIGKLFIIALVLDTIYQVIALHTVHVVQTLIVAVGVAVIPYTLLRGIATRLTRRASKKQG